MVQGSQFTDIQPTQPFGLGRSYAPADFTPNGVGLDTLTSRQFVSETFDKFRIGQTIFFEFEIFLDVPGITALQLMPWWLRPQQEFRAIGPTVTAADYIQGPSLDGVDIVAFGAPGLGLATTNRIWQNDPQQEQQVAPTFPAVPAGKVFANMLENVWRFPIDQAQVVPGYSKTFPFYWPAFGYALAFTSEHEGSPGQGPKGAVVIPRVKLSWKTGATHSITQQNVD